MTLCRALHYFFFFNDTATTEIYTLSLHTLFRSLEESRVFRCHQLPANFGFVIDPTGDILQACRHHSPFLAEALIDQDRKSTRLNSSHSQISYAVFCLKKKKDHNTHGAPSSHPVH